MIETIIFDANKYDGFEAIHNGKETINYKLANLSKINIFIGQNNSGKSRFLRTLFCDNDFEFNMYGYDVFEVQNIIRAYRNRIRSQFMSYGFSEINGVIKNLENLLREIKFNKNNLNMFIAEVNVFLKQLQDNYVIINTSSQDSYTTNPNNPALLIPFIQKEGVDLEIELKKVMPELSNFHTNNVYIPILRGLRPIQLDPNKGNNFSGSDDNYKERTLQDYFKKIELDTSCQIFTGLNLYNDIKELLLGNKDKRELVRKFEDFLSKNFFQNQPVSLVPHLENEVLTVDIGNELDRPVYALGDGIQALFILLYPLFLNQGNNLLVFIEEPELSMHPGMQRMFIETLLRDEFKNYQYFITTHSNHFLDITLDEKDISIYTFQKSVNSAQKIIYKIENTNCGEIAILDLIGARNSSIFLSNCTIWVEGITDRLYLRKYLEVYQNSPYIDPDKQNKFREDIHFSFVEYGGGNITHWSFSDGEKWDKIKTSRICNKIFLVADKDDTERSPDSAKAVRLKVLKDNLGDNFYQTQGREIENSISKCVLIATVRELDKGKHSDDLEIDETAIIESTYKNIGLGKFIDDNFRLSKKISSVSGSINSNYKVDFCRTATEKIQNADDLSEEGKQIAEKLYNFIKNCNVN